MSATWRDLARKDIEDAIRSKVLVGLIGTFVAFLLTALLSADQLVEGVDEVTTSIALAGVATLAQLFIPGVAVVAGYLAITGERRRGSLRMLMSYPFTPGDIVIGKLLGRMGVTLLALLVGFAVGSVVIVIQYGTPEPGLFAGFVGAGILLGAVFTALAVGGSAIAKTRGQAMALTVGPYVAMVFFWKPVVVGIYYVVYRRLPPLETESWYFLARRLNPLEAYRAVVGRILDEPVQAVPYLPLEDIPAGTLPAHREISARVGEEAPFYLTDWFAVIILVAWGAVPIVVGYWRFVNSDID